MNEEDANHPTVLVTTWRLTVSRDCMDELTRAKDRQAYEQVVQKLVALPERAGRHFEMIPASGVSPWREWLNADRMTRAPVKIMHRLWLVAPVYWDTVVLLCYGYE